jgi:putative transposase
VSIEPGAVHRRFIRDRRDLLWATFCDRASHPRGWIYCAVVLDVYYRRVVGWSIDSSQTTALMTHALGMAIDSRRPAPGDTLVR